MNNVLQKKIVIVGAGISGLACAVALKAIGFTDVCILEAQDRIGGRIKTVPFGPHIIEMGAQWIHGQQNNVIYDIANSNGLVDKNALSYIDVLQNFNNLPEDKKDLSLSLFKYLNDILSSTSYENTNSSVISDLNKHFDIFMSNYSQNPLKDFLHEFYDWFCKFQCELNGCQNMSRLSKSSLSAYDECDGNLTTELKRGYCSLLDLFLENVPSEWILTSHEVIKIDWSALCGNNLDTVDPSKNNTFSKAWCGVDKYVKVFCGNGKTFFVDHVIITVPLGYLKKHSQTLFHPCLSEKKQQAISCLGFGVVNKIYMNFDVPFWEANYVIHVLWQKKFDEHFPNEDSSCDTISSQHWVKGINRFAYTLKQPNLLCAWVTGEGAVILEKLSDNKVIDDCMKLLELILEKKLPRPSVIVRSSWGSDPFTCGSYSYLSVQCDEKNVSHQDISEPEYSSVQCAKHPVLQFAGEASHKNYFSTVHGACESGFREADRLFNYYRIQDLDEYPDQLMTLNDKLKLLLMQRKEFRERIKIIIIGAGIAGLSCASHLAKNNFTNVHVLEALERTGGRVRSKIFDDGVLELGAQWIHGSENELYKFSENHGILPPLQENLYSEGRGKFCSSSGGRILPHMVEEVKRVLNKTKFKLEKGSPSFKDKSVLSIFSEAFDNYIEKCNDKSDIATKQGLFDWYMRFEVIDNACDSLDNVACQSYAEWDDCPAEDYHMETEKGFSSIIEALESEIPCANISTNKPVKTIKWQENFIQKNYSESFFKTRTEDNFPCSVICEDGETIFADCVIVTASVGFLKEHCSTFFYPPLPQNKCKALESTGFGTINKIYLVFEKAFWASTDTGIQLVWTNEVNEGLEKLKNEHPWIRGITGFDRVIRLPNVLVGWIGGEEAKLIESISDDVVSSVCTKLISIFLRLGNVPNPVSIYRSKWFQNSYARGAYSYRTLSYYQSPSTLHDLQYPLCSSYETKQDLKIQWPTVLFAGEALDSKSFSSAHGAYRSGFNAAESVRTSFHQIELSGDF